jgi:CO/xanthine dehydrogenase Mo-binding subunit
LAAYRLLGSTIPRIEGAQKVTGAARYAADIDLPNLAWGRILRSPLAHARIVQIDTSRAEALPGVLAVMTGKDVEGVRVGNLLIDMPALCWERVRYVGDPIAAVAAESPEIAEEALGLIEVQYDELPVVTRPEAAMRDEAPLIHPEYDSYKGKPEVPPIRNLQSRTVFGKGDVEAGLAEADRIFEHTFHISRMHQAYIEPRACVVQIETGGPVRVWSSCKVPFTLRNKLAAMFELPQERLIVVPCNIGGDFGGKGPTGPEPLAYWLAQRTGRPIKIVNSYVEEIQAGNPRHGGTITIRTGVKSDGRITAREARIVFNGGAYAGYRNGPGVGMPSVIKALGSYRMEHSRVETLWVYTNTAPGGIMRGPGHPQVVFAGESQIDLIADELGIDPLELRLRNVLREGDQSPTGDKLEGVQGVATLELTRQAAGWAEPLGPNRGRGVALTDRPINAAPSGLTLRIDEDGRFQAVSGIPDVGTGAFTILKAVLAEQLQVPFEAVEIVHGDTNTALFDAGIGGSKTTYSSNHSATETTTALKARLAEAAASRLECSAEDVELVDGAFQVRGHPGSRLPLLELGAELASEQGSPLEVQAPGPKERPPQPCFVTNVVEVEVDPETGRITPLKLTAVHDVGFAINPQLLQAQIDGGTMQGFGFAAMEEIPVDESGLPATVNFDTYKIPTTADIPHFESVLLDGPTGPGPFGAKAVGELSLTVLAPALASAVAQAVGARVMETPISAERVRSALRKG